MHSRDKQRVQTGAAPLRRRSCVHAYGRPTPCTRSHTKAAGREHSGAATRVAFTRTFVDYNRHFGPAPFIPAAALPVPVDVDHCAHTHICARRPQGECSQHERPTCRQTTRGTRLAKGLLQACRRDPLCCSLVLPHGKSGFTLFRLIAQEGRKQAFRLQLGSSACAFAAPKLPRNRKSGNYINPWAAPVRPLQADRNQSSRFMVGKLHENCESMISMISCGMIFTPQKVALQVTGRIAFSNVHV